MRRRLAVGEVQNAGPQTGPAAADQRATDADFRVIGVRRDDQDI
jgi:hypothetical protein